MPHIIIEHSKEEGAELDLKNLAKTLHYKLSEHETISLPAIKTRTLEVSNVLIGDKSCSNKFIHITLLLLAGRKNELKEKIIKSLFKTTESFINNTDYTITIETRDLETYFKL